MRPFYFIRHGETDWNKKTKRLQGHTDIPLNEVGRTQAQSLAPLIQNLGLTRMISSDLSRAHETAQILAQGSIPLETDRRLREVKLGVVEGLSPAEVDRQYGADFRKNWGSNFDQFRDLHFPQGESRSEVLIRAFDVVQEFLEKYPQDILAFVAHGFLIRSLAFERKEIQTDFFIPNCAVAPFHWTPEKKIVYVGATNPKDLLQPAMATFLE